MAFQKGVPRPANAGRKKGSANRATAALKDMVLGALDEAGGQDYLLEQAKAEPKAFLALLGKILPTQVSGVDGAPIEMSLALRQERARELLNAAFAEPERKE